MPLPVKILFSSSITHRGNSDATLMPNFSCKRLRFSNCAQWVVVSTARSSPAAANRNAPVQTNLSIPLPAKQLEYVLARVRRPLPDRFENLPEQKEVSNPPKDGYKWHLGWTVTPSVVATGASCANTQSTSKLAKLKIWVAPAKSKSVAPS